MANATNKTASAATREFFDIIVLLFQSSREGFTAARRAARLDSTRPLRSESPALENPKVETLNWTNRL